MRRPIHSQTLAWFATWVVACALLWANLIPVRGSNRSHGSLGVFYNRYTSTIGWPTAYKSSLTRTVSFASWYKRSPEVKTETQFLWKGLLANMVVAMLMGISTFWVTWNFEFRRLQFHLSTLFVLTFVVAVFCAMYSQMASIDSLLGKQASLSRLLTNSSQWERDLVNAITGSEGFWFPFQIRLPLLFGLGAVIFVIGKILVTLPGRVLELSSSHTTISRIIPIATPSGKSNDARRQ